MYFTRSHYDLYLKNEEVSTQIKFTNAMNILKDDEWTFYAFSIGWTSIEDDYILWAYIYQE